MPNPEITCKLTGTVGPGVDCHIIPKSFYRDLARGSPSHLVSIGPSGIRKKKSPVGVYDQTIVTAEGERFFGAGDDYAAKFFLNAGNHNRGRGGRHYPGLAFVLEPGSFDPFLIRYFAITLPWRAGVSNHHFFGAVVLGRHEERLRRLILAGEAGGLEEYPVLLGRYDDTPLRGWPFSGPERIVLGGFGFVRFRLHQFVMDVKLDDRPVPADLLPIAVGGASELAFMSLGTWADSLPMQRLADEMRRPRGGKPERPGSSEGGRKALSALLAPSIAKPALFPLARAK